jgi:hypothetical protein
MKTIDIEKLIELVLKDAENQAESAGYGGRMDDGGASKMRSQVEFYRAGLNKTFPPEWDKYVKKYLEIYDPEYSEYIRLKQKFENESL